jgi:hypothetical protein
MTLDVLMAVRSVLVFRSKARSWWMSRAVWVPGFTRRLQAFLPLSEDGDSKFLQNTVPPRDLTRRHAPEDRHVSIPQKSVRESRQMLQRLC